MLSDSESSSSINFFSQHPEFHWDSSISTTAEWIKRCAQQHEHGVEELNVIAMTDDALLQINQEFLNHDTFTDIVTFDDSANGFISGELYLSIDRIRENAASLDTLFDEELHRVIIHGVLHLLGYGDKSREDATVMRERENEWLTLR